MEFQILLLGFDKKIGWELGFCFKYDWALGFGPPLFTTLFYGRKGRGGLGLNDKKCHEIKNQWKDEKDVNMLQQKGKLDTRLL